MKHAIAVLIALWAVVTGVGWAADNQKTSAGSMSRGRLTTPASPAAFSAQRLNDLFGVALWSDTLLWDEPADAVLARLQGTPQANAGDESSLSVQVRTKILDVAPEQVRLLCRNGKVNGVTIYYVNKGDSVSRVGDPATYKTRSMYNEALAAHRRALSSLGDRIRSAAVTIRTRLSAALGEPVHKSSGAGGAATEDSELWRVGRYAILLIEEPRDSLILRIIDGEQVGTGGQNVERSGADLRQTLHQNVQRRPNGDVVITGIPMINQGGKGYCVPATWSRYFKYMGIEVDEYVLARAGNTRPGGGTSFDDMVNAAKTVASSNRRYVRVANRPFSLSFVADNIDQGLPIMWGMLSVGPFHGLGKSAERMGSATPAAWAEQLRPARLNATRIPRDLQAAHVCLLIGYNRTTGEIAVSDSWGAGHEEKWYTVEEARRVSQDRFAWISW